MRSFLYTYDDGWDWLEGYAPRLLDSVILEPGEKEHLVQDVEYFRQSKRRYASLGVPYHRGYLLYGPPGTGKTSLVSALAANFGLSIYLINLADFNDRSLMKAVNRVPANSVLLFEDIDCMKSGKARAPSSPSFRVAECAGWFQRTDEYFVRDDDEQNRSPGSGVASAGAN
jgi:chaperone BCS1